MPTKRLTLLEGGNMIENLDELDMALINRIETTQCTSMSDVIKPFLLEHSESGLRTRIRTLALHGLIRTRKNIHGRILCRGVEENRNASVTSTGGRQNSQRNARPRTPGEHTQGEHAQGQGQGQESRICIH